MRIAGQHGLAHCQWLQDFVCQCHVRLRCVAKHAQHYIRIADLLRHSTEVHPRHKFNFEPARLGSRQRCSFALTVSHKTKMESAISAQQCDRVQNDRHAMVGNIRAKI